MEGGGIGLKKKLDLGDVEWTLEGGGRLSEVEVAYTTKGVLSPLKDNVVCVCHALTGDQYMADCHPLTGKPGWWEKMVGPGLAIDTDKFFVVCSNVLGGCLGTTGPMSKDPKTGLPYGLSFPEVSIGDMVRVQKALMESMGIDRVFAVVGGSMGAMQVLDWIVRYPESVGYAVVVAGASRHTPQNIAFHESGRAAIMSDPHFYQGSYYDKDEDMRPRRGLAVARMMAHITYLSEGALQRKFGRRRRDGGSRGFQSDFEVESYLRYQGSNFVKRFDANSYLYLTRAMDIFDLSSEGEGSLVKVLSGVKSRVLVVSFSSDWLFPPRESKLIVRALAAGGCFVSGALIESESGHDSFLLDDRPFLKIVGDFLRGGWRNEGGTV
jgi:homoserine O-acetyltransferase